MELFPSNSKLFVTMKTHLSQSIGNSQWKSSINKHGKTTPEQELYCNLFQGCHCHNMSHWDVHEDVAILQKFVQTNGAHLWASMSRLLKNRSVDATRRRLERINSVLRQFYKDTPLDQSQRAAAFLKRIKVVINEKKDQIISQLKTIRDSMNSHLSSVQTLSTFYKTLERGSQLGEEDIGKIYELCSETKGFQCSLDDLHRETFRVNPFKIVYVDRQGPANNLLTSTASNNIKAKTSKSEQMAFNSLQQMLMIKQKNEKSNSQEMRCIETAQSKNQTTELAKINYYQAMGLKPAMSTAKFSIIFQKPAQQPLLRNQKGKDAQGAGQHKYNNNQKEIMKEQSSSQEVRMKWKIKNTQTQRKYKKIFKDGRKYRKQNNFSHCEPKLRDPHDIKNKRYEQVQTVNVQMGNSQTALTESEKTKFKIIQLLRLRNMMANQKETTKGKLRMEEDTSGRNSLSPSKNENENPTIFQKGMPQSNFYHYLASNNASGRSIKKYGC